jgi:hypothetical protein
MARFAVFLEDAVLDGQPGVVVRFKVVAESKIEADGPVTPAATYGMAIAALLERPETVKELLAQVTEQEGMGFPETLPPVTLLD